MLKITLSTLLQIIHSSLLNDYLTVHYSVLYVQMTASRIPCFVLLAICFVTSFINLFSSSSHSFHVSFYANNFYAIYLRRKLKRQCNYAFYAAFYTVWRDFMEYWSFCMHHKSTLQYAIKWYCFEILPILLFAICTLESYSV